MIGFLQIFLNTKGYEKSSTNAVQRLRLLELCFCQIQKRMEEMAGAGLDTTSLDDEAFNTEAAQDRCILRLIASCCNGESYYYYLLPSFPICLIYILKK